MNTEGQFNVENIKVILLDVAGTTTSINFVKETLFPYAVSKAENYLKDNWEDAAVKKAIKDLDSENELDVTAAVKVVKDLTDKNSDNIGLKSLQGLLFKAGYENGDIQAHVFDDVAPSIKSWAGSYKIAIFSTGSVESQKLLFAHTIEGDLTTNISKYFDQAVGTKTDLAAYQKVADDLKVKINEIFFVTDNAAEAKAAKAAGAVANLIEREGNAELTQDIRKEFPVVSSFTDLPFNTKSKRKNEEAEVEAPPSKLPKTEEKPEEKAKTDEVEVMETEEQKEDIKAEETAATNTEETAKETDKKEVAEEKTEPAVTEEEVPSKDKEEEKEKTSAEEEKAEQPSAPAEKTEEASQKTEEPEKVETDEKEKENKSDIANGAVETDEGCDKVEKVNGKGADSAEVEESKEPEIKGKKLEEAEEKPAVTVECT